MRDAGYAVQRQTWRVAIVRHQSIDAGQPALARGGAAWPTRPVLPGGVGLGCPMFVLDGGVVARSVDCATRADGLFQPGLAARRAVYPHGLQSAGSDVRPSYGHCFLQLGCSTNTNGLG